MQKESERKQILDMLQRIPVFGGVSEDALHYILESAETRSVPENEYFFREDDPPRSMFVLIRGRVAVVKTIDAAECKLGTMDPGDCFGELELIDFCPRAASIRATEDCRAIELAPRILHGVAKIDPTSFTMLQMNMGREVSRRLRRLDEELADLSSRAGTGTPGEDAASSPGSGPVRDLPVERCRVCTKHVRPHEEHWEVRHEGVSYVVCCPLCAQAFGESPERFLDR